jgi:hypothetical protein
MPRTRTSDRLLLTAILDLNTPGTEHRVPRRRLRLQRRLLNIECNAATPLQRALGSSTKIQEASVGMTTQRADTLGAIDFPLLPLSSDPSPDQAIVAGPVIALEACDHVQVVSMTRTLQASGAKAIRRWRGCGPGASSLHASYLYGMAANVLDVEAMREALQHAMSEEIDRTIEASREATTSQGAPTRKSFAPAPLGH